MSSHGQILTRAASRSLIVAAAAALVLIIALVLYPLTFLRAYLAAFIFWSAVPLGAAAMLMTHHLATGRWGKALRPSLESAVATMPLVPLFFLPILIGARWLYPWADPQHLAIDPVLQHQQVYLNLPFFIVRAIIYFAIWTLGARLLARWSSHRDPHSEVPRHNLQTLCAVGLVIYAVTITFAAIDWLASLQPGWYSSIFGLYFLIGQALAGFSILVLFLVTFAGWIERDHAHRSRAAAIQNGLDDGVEPASSPLPPSVLHDFGNLLLTLVVLHTYLSFSQFFIIWNGNLPIEAAWYVPRTRAGWGVLATVIVVIDFVIPFTLLLFRAVKRRPRTLAAVAAVVLAARLIEAPWLVLPSFPNTGVAPVMIAVIAAVALGGFWLADFARRWSRVPLAFIETPEQT